MIMPWNIRLLLLLCITSASVYAQSDTAGLINIGDPAPPLRVHWLKGEPVLQFEKGKLYVVEFWASWCIPCKAAMPHLSDLARTYKDKVIFLGIDIYEQKTTSLQKIKGFVDSMGQKMDYKVAKEDSNFMATDWLNATGEQVNGIPQTFVVNREGKLAWIGHPADLAAVLPEIVNNKWDIKTALANRNETKRLTAIDNDVYYDLINYTKSPNWAGSSDKPDSLLMAIADILRKEPKLKYAPNITSLTFFALLKIDMHKAYEYGQQGLLETDYRYKPSFFIVQRIDNNADSLHYSQEIYHLGAQACQLEIDQTAYPEIANTYKLYNKMADWYWLANEPAKAREAQEMAIEILKSKKEFSATELNAYESRLQQYKDSVVFKLP